MTSASCRHCLPPAPPTLRRDRVGVERNRGCSSRLRRPRSSRRTTGKVPRQQEASAVEMIHGAEWDFVSRQRAAGARPTEAWHSSWRHQQAEGQRRREGAFLIPALQLIRLRRGLYELGRRLNSHDGPDWVALACCKHSLRSSRTLPLMTKSLYTCMLFRRCGGGEASCSQHLPSGLAEHHR